MTEGALDPNKAVKCPHCQGELSYAIKTRLMNESRMVFSLKPAPGEFMNAKNVGGAIEQMGKLLTAIGKDMGVKTQVLVEKLTTAEDGTIAVELLLARHQDGVKVRQEHSSNV